MISDYGYKTAIKGIIEMNRSLKELARLRNRHVAKLLTYIGDSPPYLETAIKKAFTMFSDDVEANIINSDNRDNEDGNS